MKRVQTMPLKLNLGQVLIRALDKTSGRELAVLQLYGDESLESTGSGPSDGEEGDEEEEEFQPVPSSVEAELRHAHWKRFRVSAVLHRVQLSIAPYDEASQATEELEVLLSSNVGDSEKPLCQVEFSNLDANQSRKAQKATEKIQRSRLAAQYYIQQEDLDEAYRNLDIIRHTTHKRAVTASLDDLPSIKLELGWTQLILSPKLISQFTNSLKAHLPPEELQGKRSYTLELTLASWEACQGVLTCHGMHSASCSRCGFRTTVKKFWAIHSIELCDAYKEAKEQGVQEPDACAIAQSLGTVPGWRDLNKKMGITVRPNQNPNPQQLLVG